MKFCALLKLVISKPILTKLKIIKIIDEFLLPVQICFNYEAKKIYDVLKTGDIKKSRIQLSYIVGRDTENLSEKEIERIKEFSKDLIEISKAGLIEREYGEEEYLLIKKEID